MDIWLLLAGIIAMALLGGGIGHLVSPAWGAAGMVASLLLLAWLVALVLTGRV